MLTKMVAWLTQPTIDRLDIPASNRSMGKSRPTAKGRLMASNDPGLAARRRVAEEVHRQARAQYDAEIKRRDDIFTSLAIPLGVVAAIGTMIAVFAKFFSEAVGPAIIVWHKSRPGVADRSYTFLEAIIYQLYGDPSLESVFIACIIVALVPICVWHACLRLLDGARALKECAVGFEYSYAVLKQPYIDGVFGAMNSAGNGVGLDQMRLEELNLMILRDQSILLVRCAVGNLETNRVRMRSRKTSIDSLAKSAYNIGVAFFVTALALLVISGGPVK